jgi:hypothetical protein
MEKPQSPDKENRLSQALKMHKASNKTPNKKPLKTAIKNQSIIKQINFIINNYFNQT